MAVDGPNVRYVFCGLMFSWINRKRKSIMLLTWWSMNNPKFSLLQSKPHGILLGSIKIGIEETEVGILQQFGRECLV